MNPFASQMQPVRTPSAQISQVAQASYFELSPIQTSGHGFGTALEEAVAARHLGCVRSGIWCALCLSQDENCMDIVVLALTLESAP